MRGNRHAGLAAAEPRSALTREPDLLAGVDAGGDAHVQHPLAGDHVPVVGHRLQALSDGQHTDPDVATFVLESVAVP